MSQTYVPADLRRLVAERAQYRCEYCLIPEWATFAPHEIDHIVSEKHGGPTEETNLAYACTLCNKNKGSDLTSIDPHSSEIVPLFHPRQDVWATHFILQGGQLEPLTAKGRVTVKLLQLNDPERVEEREGLLAAKLWMK